MSTSRGISKCTLPQCTAEAALRALQPGPMAVETCEDTLLSSAVDLLTTYFAGRPIDFNLPLDLDAHPPFTRRVLLECSRIPYGTTVSYGALAARAGSPRAARAVGQVMAHNPIAIIIPCHRVVGTSGQLTGFGGGLGMKDELLQMEAAALTTLAAAKCACSETALEGQ